MSQQEKDKWDAIYADMPLISVDSNDAVTSFNEEMLTIMNPLLARGSTVLEAGCGGGAQSLTLALRGGYQVSLLDFSSNALDYARRLFAQHGTPVHTIEADAFAPGPAEYDMVFNAGVLEHYSFDEQVRFLKGMASRSQRYVMVLLPNRACYWYWLWRIQKAANGEWPYGKEVPLVDMRAVFEAAGLNYLGQSFLGKRWCQSFVEELEGLSPELRSLILQAQQSNVLPSHTEGYLVAALGAVAPGECLPVTKVWTAGSLTELRVEADQTALLADVIANEVHSKIALRRSLDEIERIRRDAEREAGLSQRNSELLAEALHGAVARESMARHEAVQVVEQAAVRSSEVQKASLQALQEAYERSLAIQQSSQLAVKEAQERSVAIQQSSQLAEKEAQEREQIAQQAALLLLEVEKKHSALAYAEIETLSARRTQAEAQLLQILTSHSWQITKPLRFSLRLLRYGWLLEDKAQLRQVVKLMFNKLPLPRKLRTILRNTGVSLLGQMPPSKRVLPTNIPIPTTPPPDFEVIKNISDKPDYFFWGVIDWHFRFQRPQQLAHGLANTGRRVFYISPELRQSEIPGYELEKLNSSETLFQVFFQVKSPIPIYGQLPNKELADNLLIAFGQLLRDIKSLSTIQMVQHPFWSPIATTIPNSRCIYDCMDHHAGFENTATEMNGAENNLIQHCDEVIVTSQWLNDEMIKHKKPIHLIRNGCDYNHFNIIPNKIYQDRLNRKIIGYFGAIAPWMDLKLLREVALNNPNAVLLMIGDDTTNAKRHLKDIFNIEWIGEVSYEKLPFYAHSFSVALLPFKVIPLTLATNPVKVYEYLSAGLDVVCIELPETVAFSSVARVAKNHTEFINSVSFALQVQTSKLQRDERLAFAIANTWNHRIEELLQVSEPNSKFQIPQISVVVVTYNNIDLTRACLTSIEQSSGLEPLEIIVVDNASSDETPDFLRNWQEQGSHRKIILNPDNRGFAAANNQGLRLAKGDYLCLLNNDTFVTAGWATTLKNFLRRNLDVGLIGPVTNNIGNEARININYTNMTEMATQANNYTTRHIGKSLDIDAVAFFCVMLSRNTFEKIGFLDEAYGLGFFEDDDYCMQVKTAGLRVVCCDSVFIHHHLSASFDKIPKKSRQVLMEKNKKLFESKWGTWKSHAYRQ